MSHFYSRNSGTYKYRPASPQAGCCGSIKPATVALPSKTGCCGGGKGCENGRTDFGKLKLKKACCKKNGCGKNRTS